MVSRYGVKIRTAEKAVLRAMHAAHECPKCGKKRVKRVGTALWRCRSCGAEFAGGAYIPATTIGITVRKIVESLKPFESEGEGEGKGEGASASKEEAGKA